MERMKTLICLVATSMVITAPVFAEKPFRSSTHKLVPNYQGPKVRVLLAENVISALVESKGAYRVVNRADGSILSSGSIGKRYGLHALQKGLRWGEEYPDVYEITIKPVDEESSLFVDGIQYKGAISVYHAPNHRITIVNEIPIENFLLSVLSVKYDFPVAKEALAALTILERGDVYSRVERNSHGQSWYDYTVEEIGYKGHGVIKRSLGIDTAVQATRFMVMEGHTEGRSLPNVSQLEELAHMGLDAKQILRSCYPTATIGLTTPIPSKIIR
jgi:stage II sporulation protein D